MQSDSAKDDIELKNRPDYSDLDRIGIEEENEKDDKVPTLKEKPKITIQNNKTEEKINPYEKQIKINTILKYQRFFKNELVAYEDKLDVNYLYNLSLEELNELDKQLRVVCSNGNVLSTFLKPVVYNGIGLIEEIGCRAGLKVNGFYKMLEGNEKLEKNMFLIEQMYGQDMFVDPIYSLVGTIFVGLGLCHQRNTLLEDTKNVGEEKLNDKLKDEFEDL